MEKSGANLTTIKTTKKKKFVTIKKSFIPDTFLTKCIFSFKFHVKY